MKNKKTAPWRIAAFVVSVAFIVFVWVRKDIVNIYATTAPEYVLPLIATTIAVSLVKVLAIASIVFIVKWIVGKVRNK